MLRRLACCLVLAALALPAAAQTGAGKPMRIVVAFPAGGPMDIVARPLAQKLSESLGTPVVIDNRAGANGIIGIDNVAKSAPDGSSLVVGSAGALAINSLVYSKLPFDVTRDLAPVANIINLAELLCVHPSLPVKTVRDLVALAKARPGQLNYGSSGQGGMPHLASELFLQAASAKIAHIAYKGAGPATTDAIGGHVQMVFLDIPVLVPHVKSGKLRALAVGTPRRSQALPEVPTLIESGYPGVEVYNWYALFTTGGTPRDTINRLNGEINKVLSTPDMKSFYLQQGGEVATMSADQLGQLLRDELVKWGRVVKSTGVKLD